MVSEISYQRRYTLPFVSSTLAAPLDDSKVQVRHNHRHQVHKYEISEQDLENERPFMSGRQGVDGDSADLPIPKPIHVREILSDEELENERPFMSGRVKVPKEVLKERLRTQWNFFKALTKKGWKNEKPFMHGRNEKGQDSHPNLIQVAPTATTVERENERPYMHGRVPLRKSRVERRRQRKLVEVVSKDGNETGDDHKAEVTQRVTARKGPDVGMCVDVLCLQKTSRQKRQGRRLCPPCRVLNDFRKAKLVPAVKSARGLLTGRNTDYTVPTLRSQWHTAGDKTLLLKNHQDESDKAKLLKTRNINR